MKKVLLGIGLVSAGAPAAFAQATNSMELITTATTAFEGVSVLVVAMAGFYIVLRIVKGIRS